MNRSDFPFFALQNRKEYVYLDSAATTLKPQIVIDAITRGYVEGAGNARRGLYEDAEKAAIAIENTRTIVADFLKVSADTLLFTKNTTDSINTVAQSWAEHNITEGDEIVVTAREHHANLVLWQQCAQRKDARFVVIPVDQKGELVENCFDYITSKTKLLAIGHLSNVTGLQSEFLQQLIIRAKKMGAAVLVDGAQAVSYIEDPINQLDTDFYAFSAHKMCGPYGVGILYVKKDRQKEMVPAMVGGGAIYDVTENQTTFLPFPQGFEAGTMATPEIVGFGKAVEYIDSVGVSAVASYTNALVKIFLNTIDRAKITIVGDYDRVYNESHIVSFTVQGFHAHDVAAYLAQKNIAVRAGNHCAQPFHNAMRLDATIRVSFYIYNTQDDVMKCVTALHQLCS